MARIALLPLETVCQGNKRLQATRLARDSENAFLKTHVFCENHAAKMERFLERLRAGENVKGSVRFRSVGQTADQFIDVIKTRKFPSQQKHREQHQAKRDCRELMPHGNRVFQ
jgi:hypothetical protein